jgi:hypothetical protein
MTVEKTEATIPKADVPAETDAERERRVRDFRARAEEISRQLAGREHSDSGALLAEDRER